jgi:osmotically-inducible protein OsmY
MAAFRRNATVDASKVNVSTIGNKVVLTGKVRSFAESEDAEDVAWAAPGVYHVENKLTVEEPEYAF